MMENKSYLFVLSLVSLFLLSAQIFAADRIDITGEGFQIGYEAYSRGDYTAALKIWVPLAKQGDRDACTRWGRSSTGLSEGAEVVQA